MIDNPGAPPCSLTTNQSQGPAALTPNFAYKNSSETIREFGFFEQKLPVFLAWPCNKPFVVDSHTGRQDTEAFLPGSSVYSCRHWLSRFISKGWAPNTTGRRLIYPVNFPETSKFLCPRYKVFYKFWADSYRYACAYGYRLCYIVAELCMPALICWCCMLSSLCSGRALPLPTSLSLLQTPNISVLFGLTVFQAHELGFRKLSLCRERLF